MIKKLPNECLFCRNRFCYSHIYRLEQPFYNEIACRKHQEDLEKHADDTLGGRGSGVMRMHRSSTGVVSRKDVTLKSVLDAQEELLKELLND